MEQLNPRPLDYHHVPRGSARWVMWSLGVGVGTYVVVIGLALGLLYFVGSIRHSSHPAAILLPVLGLVVMFAPAVGLTFGALGLRRTARRRWLAVVAIVLNLSVWGIVVLIMLFQPR